MKTISAFSRGLIYKKRKQKYLIGRLFFRGRFTKRVLSYYYWLNFFVSLFCILLTFVQTFIQHCTLSLSITEEKK